MRSALYENKKACKNDLLGKIFNTQRSSKKRNRDQELEKRKEIGFALSSCYTLSMIKNPFLNAFYAAAYIVVIVFVLGHFDGVAKVNQTILAPITILSLLVFSVALMGMLFFFTPLKMFLDNQKDAALAFFFKELGTFACFVAVFIILLIVL